MTILVSLLAVLVLALWVAMQPFQSQTSDGGRAIAENAPSLMVLPFENGSGDPAQDIFTGGITEEVIAALIHFKDVLVFGADTTFQYRTEPALRNAVPNVHIDYVLKGRVEWMGNQVQVNVTLLRANDRQYLWSDSFRQDFNPGNVIGMRQDIANHVASVLVQPHGIIDKAELQNTAGRPSESLSSYECVLRVREYWRQPNAEQHRQVRACLERAIQSDPHYADAWAALAFIYTDEVRVGFNPTPARPDPASTALPIAKRAVALAPDDPLPLQAIGIAHWLRREPLLSIAAYERALALNPHDSDILADLGRAYILTGNWAKGIPLLQQAFERNPAQPSWFRQFTAIYHYMEGRYDEALAEALRIGQPDLVYAHVVMAMIYGQIGRKDDATQEVDEILRLYPNFGDKAVFEFERRNMHPAIIAKMIDGLRKAGLSIPDEPTASAKQD